jgi:4-amino-4-deoxy-L-arabinose transferase-like glycosyltransferase
MRWSELPWRWLLVVMALSVAAQLFVTANVTLLPDYDEGIYWDVSRNCHHTGLFLRSIGKDSCFFFDHPPLFTYLASPVFFLTDDIAGIRAVVSLLSCLLLAATSLLAGRLFGRGAALPTAVILAFNPMFVFYSNKVYQDIPFCLPIVLAYLAAFRGRRLAAGVLTGAAFLVKYFAFGFAGILALYCFLSGPGGKRGTVLFLAGFLAVASLWPLAGMLFDPAGFLAKLDYWNSHLSSRMEVLHPVGSLGELLQSVLDRLSTLHAVLLAAALLGMARRWRELELPARITVVTAVAYIAVLLGGFHFRGDRYWVEALPFLAAIAGAWSLQLPAMTRWPILLMIAVCGLVIPMPGMLKMPLMTRPYYAPPVHEFVRDTRAAAEAAARVLRPGEPLMADWNGPRMGYLTRHPYEFLFPTQTLEQAFERVKSYRVLVRDHELGRWYMPYLTRDETDRLEARLTAECDTTDFGRVRLYVRRAAPMAGSQGTGTTSTR